MILFYRLPGFVAVISLLGQMGLAIAAVSGYFPVFSSFTMTLPGIAGLILSIGMGVDCNVITAERIKEELKAGRTLDGALERGTKNSLSAIVDGNMTTQRENPSSKHLIFGMNKWNSSNRKKCSTRLPSSSNSCP